MTRPTRSANGRCQPRGSAILLLLATLAGCGSGNDSPESSERTKPVVVVVNDPLQFFAERLAGDAVEIVNPVPADADPTDWQPTDDDVRTMQEADAILLNGSHFSKWTRRVSLPDEKLIDTTRALRDRLIRVEDFTVHKHGSGGAHSHPGTAPNTFLDPALALEQAKAVRETLIELVPDERAAIEERYESLAAELQEIDQTYEEALTDAEPTPVFASHPFCNYAGRRAKWDVVHLHWQPDEMPSDEQWDALEEKLIDHSGNWMLWAEPPIPEIEAGLAKLGIATTVLDPAHHPPENGDFLDTLRANLDVVRKVVNDERPTGSLPEPAAE